MDKDFKALLIAMVTVISVFVVSVLFVKSIENSLAKEAIKAGLVQKLEQNKIIWVRP